MRVGLVIAVEELDQASPTPDPMIPRCLASLEV
jgi:hypothetical protein